MNSQSGRSSYLKEACQLTGASWAAYFSKEQGNNWRAHSYYYPSIKNRDLFVLKVTGKINSVDHHAGRVWTWAVGLSANEQVDLDCHRLFGFKISSEKMIFVGAGEVLRAREKHIWKLVASILKVQHEYSDSNIDQLQNSVLELQLTQQELQARINAQREAETRLVQAAKLAAVGELAAGIAHELNNPLTSVVGFTELALDDLPPDANVRKDLELVLKEARRAGGVVHQLLDFARQSETLRVKGDINEIINDVLILSKHMMQTNNVNLELQLGENLPWVIIDRNQIKQVAINLINNAIYAMPDGGTIRIQTSEKTRYGRDWIILSIQDNGLGIPEQNLERIFEPFFTTRADRGGTGLGLSVTYGIVTDHGGMIEVESQVNVGSAFIVWLPLEVQS